MRIIRRTALLGLVALGVTACGGESTPSTPSGGAPPARERPATGDLPPELARNVRQADTLVGEGEADFRARLTELRGVPVVVNQWASWCGACRSELPFFEQATSTFRSEVAFLGLDSRDEREAAEAFMREFPSGFPSIFDEDASVAASVGGGRSWPMTFFFDRDGKQVHTRIGAYATADQLEADIRRFALGQRG
jgi:cytochrome c biogenesis protein CcmG/thiol:disulfide interchange protein DsbE